MDGKRVFGWDRQTQMTPYDVVRTADVLCLVYIPRIGWRACHQPWKLKSEEFDGDKVKSRMAE
jgi:hypothetical protein